MKMNNKGFSLIELMIVVGIIGILATVAMPKFESFQAKARMSEAKVMLNHIYTLQEAYSIDNGKYFVNTTAPSATNYYGFNLSTGAIIGTAPNCDTTGFSAAVGLSISPCDANSPKFAYYIQTNATGSTFNANASSGAGDGNRVKVGNTTAAKFKMDQSKTLSATCDMLTGKKPGTSTACTDAEVID